MEKIDLHDKSKDFLSGFVEGFKINPYLRRCDHEIITPYLDRHNDHIIIYLNICYCYNYTFTVRDDGVTIGDLKMCGFETKAIEKIREKLKIEKVAEYYLITYADKSNLVEKTNDFLEKLEKLSNYDYLKL